MTAAPARRLSCATCGREVGALTWAQALLVLAVGEAAFEELVAAGLIHATREPGGRTWVCEDSLFRN